jgi:hypothetical protein
MPGAGEDSNTASGGETYSLAHLGHRAHETFMTFVVCSISREMVIAAPPRRRRWSKGSANCPTETIR